MPVEATKFSWMAFLLGPLAFFNEQLVVMGLVTTAIETFLTYTSLYVPHGGMPSTLVWLAFHIALGFHGRWLGKLPPALARQSSLPRWFCWVLGLAIGVATIIAVIWPFLMQYIADYELLLLSQPPF